MKYSRNQLQILSKENPKELVLILTGSNADVSTLTLGIEFLGESFIDERIVLPVFHLLLKHINATVREGAMIGLSSFYIEKKPPQDILEKLQIMSKNDPSFCNKEFAESILKDFKRF